MTASNFDRVSKSVTGRLDIKSAVK